MPFEEDCRDRTEPGALDAMGQLVRLTAVAEQLGAGEIAVLLLVADRLHKGQAQYGNLDPATDRRDFRREAFEELADACVYLAADRLRGVRR